MVAPLAAAAATAVIGIVASMMQGHHRFAPGVCDRLEPFLTEHVVGQELALRQFSDAVCDLVRRQEAGPGKPLIMSAHGPPGVGKSLTHWLAARALYNADPLADSRCPGHACTGYKVLYGMDYVSAERAEQHAYLRAALLDHLKQVGNALLVIEEYDKLDCPTRAMFRQLFENLHSANITSGRPIILLEANTGYTQLHQMLEDVGGDRTKISAEEAQRVLKDLIFQTWAAGDCESHADTLKMVGMIDFFLPYLPLEAGHMRRLFHMRLRDEARALRGRHRCRLTWGPAELDFLVSKVDFEGSYTIEGAKEVSTVMTRHVSRLLRPWLAGQAQPDTLKERRRQATDRVKHYWQQAVTGSGAALSGALKGSGLQSGSGQQPAQKAEAESDVTLHLRVARDGRTLALKQDGG